MKSDLNNATDPWGSNETPGAVILQFSDSFNPISDPEQPISYIPLDDSAHYLSGLERKLSRVQGKTKSKRCKESKNLLDGLAMSHSIHSHEITHQDSQINTSTDNDVSISSDHGKIDPEGAIGVIMRRLTPDKVALTEEEVYKLLEADILNKMHEDNNKEDPQKLPMSTLDSDNIQNTSNHNNDGQQH